MSKVKLGDLVRDVVTGFEGIVACRTEWLTGCERLGVEPQKLQENGKPQEMGYFDVDRVELVESGKVNLPRSRNVGGPQSDPPRGKE